MIIFSFGSLFFTHYGFTDGLLFSFLCFFFPFAVSFYRPFPFAHLLVAIKWTVYGTAWFGGAVVGYWELLEGGFFAHSINGINEATFLYFGGVLCVFNFI